MPAMLGLLIAGAALAAQEVQGGPARPVSGELSAGLLAPLPALSWENERARPIPAQWPDGMAIAVFPGQLTDVRPVLGEPTGERSLLNFLAMGILPALTVPLWFLLARRPGRINPVDAPGFEVITPSEPRRFIPIPDKFQQLDFLANVKLDSPLRLSANLNRVALSIRRFGYLLEDKNFRNALLVNRRRIRRTLLKDGDVLDLGDLTLLYRDTRSAPALDRPAYTPQSGKAVIKFKRARGPVRKGTPFLVSEQYSNRIFYITKNVAYIGRSENNDLVVKAPSVAYRHAKIERIGSRYKLIDLGMAGNTFVNNRRIEQRYLKEGDLISIDKERFKYLIAPKVIRERPFPSETPFASQAEESAEPYSEEAPAV
jgi:pSer/pThr/pTyr-binding forkhead associated (FHA) protein